MSALAGIAPGLVLEAGSLPRDTARVDPDLPASVSVEEVGRLLRCGESTIRRLIRTTVLRPVEVDGTLRVRSSDVEAYRQGCAKSSARKREQ